MHKSTYSSLKLVSCVLGQSFIKRAENRRSGIDQLDADLRCQEGIRLLELLAVDEIVQLCCEFGTRGTASDDDPGEQGLTVCVAQSGAGSGGAQGWEELGKGLQWPCCNV